MTDESEEVVLLSEGNNSVDEAKRKKLVIVWQCLNPECTNSKKSSLRTANSFALSYYGLEIEKRKKRKICDTCHSSLEEYRLKLKEKLEEGVPLLSEKLPVPKELVLLEDSDEESESDYSEDSEFEIDPSSLESFSDDDDNLTVEERLQRIIGKSLGKFNLDYQNEAAVENLSHRIDDLEEEKSKTEMEFKELERDVDSLRRELYRDYEPERRVLPPLDLNEDHQSRPERLLPPPGEIQRPPISVGMKVLAMRHHLLQVWKEAVVEDEEVTKGEAREYKVKFEEMQGSKKRSLYKFLTLKNLAYLEVPSFRLTVGTRCVGLFRENQSQTGAFYSGVIAEPPKTLNKNRYLVFFDDGYANYIHHEDIRLVCSQTSPEVWADVHANSKEFVKNYMERYPERPMVRLVPGQQVKAECGGQWRQTRVVQVDASLVKLMFEKDQRVELIYRGSTRLAPLFTELDNQRRRKLEKEEADKSGSAFTRRQTAPVKKRNAPYIEYRRDGQEVDLSDSSAGAGEPSKRPVARKSTTTAKKPESSSVKRWETEGTIFQSDIKLVPSEKFRTHSCSPSCLTDRKYQYREGEHKHLNTLQIPLVLGWQRQLGRPRAVGRKRVFYTAPCGRRLRSLQETHRYLTITKSSLEIDFFNFDWWIHVMNEFKPSRELCIIKDVSYGKENIAISCVNSIDRNFPEYVEYSTDRLPQAGVNLNTDLEFLPGCDCTDDCRNKDKCACWQLTIQATRCDRDDKLRKDVGYQFRRLHEVVITGIYECNQNCACAKTCLNRVVQHPLRVKLQVFKTEKRGWGIRALHDIPQGAFVSVYVGNLYTNEEANKQGQNFGDEYFAELDMIEVIEKRKDGYESDVSDEGYDDGDDSRIKYESSDPTLRLTDEEFSSSEEDDQDFQPNRYQKRITKTGNNFSQLDGAEEAEEVADSEDKRSRRGGFSAPVGIAGPQTTKPPSQEQKFVSSRRLYGRTEDVYIMDAKSIGNIGRYLNHSCNPNVFVQNVFVDTHDLRFPWIAFFTSTSVRAGSELCWDYNYEVGSIPGKELYCSCGSDYCRGKLL